MTKVGTGQYVSYMLFLEDKHAGCISMIIEMQPEEYIQIIEKSYKDRGGIEGQRAPLKTKTAQRIRKRMVSDLRDGAILPPLVVGVVTNNTSYSELTDDGTLDSAKFRNWLNGIRASKISVIDGMQRSTAILEALKLIDDFDSEKKLQLVRVEFWISSSLNNLIYRMLVLNTGQIPWEMRRQLETVYTSLISEIEDNVSGITILKKENDARRKSAGELIGGRVIEMFLSFSSRKSNVDLKEQLAQDFARADATEATSSGHFISDFIEVLNIMVRLDSLFCDLVPSTNKLEEGRFKQGRDIFTSAPACIGFITACSVYIYGEVGFDNTESEQDDRRALLNQSMNKMIERLSIDSDIDTLELSILNEHISRKSGKVGDFERSYFQAAFASMIKNADKVKTFEACWRAY